MFFFRKTALITSLALAIAWTSFGMEEDNYTTYIRLMDPAEVAKDILNMSNWSKKRIELALSSDNYMSIESALIRNLELATIARTTGLRIEKLEQLVSFFFAYCAVNISALWNAARDAAWVTVSGDAAKAAFEAAWSSTLKAASGVTWNTPITGEAVWPVSAVANAARLAGKNVASQVARTALTKLALNKSVEIGKASWQLTSLYVLAYAAEDEFADLYLLPAYNALYQRLDSDRDFKRSKGEVINFIANTTWLRSTEHANNHHIASLARILETLAKRID